MRFCRWSWLFSHLQAITQRQKASEITRMYYHMTNLVMATATLLGQVCISVLRVAKQDQSNRPVCVP